MKAYIFYLGDQLVIRERNVKPKTVVCEAPMDKDGKYVTDMECVKLVPEVNPKTKKPTGAQVAVVNYAAYDLKKKNEQENLDNEQKRVDRRDKRLSKLKRIDWKDPSSFTMKEVGEAINFLLKDE